ERAHRRDGPGDFREPDRSGSAGGLGAYRWYRSGGLVVSRAHRHHLSVAEPAGQVGPGARAQVAVAHLGDRQGPRYLEVRVVVADREIFGGIVLAVDAVAGVGVVRERLEAVQQPRRHVQDGEVLVVQPHL